MAPWRPKKNPAPSKIFLDECFANEDDRFLSVFGQFDQYVTLKYFTLGWLNDDRPWARGQMVEYINGPLNDPGHEVVVKKILKTALERNDQDLIVHLTVAMDGLVRRKRIRATSYVYPARRVETQEYLLATPNRTQKHFPEFNRSHDVLFTQQTRAHMRRRLWRYFRTLSYSNPQEYVRRVSQTLALYEDRFFDSGEAILDNWSLMHACYFHAKEIAFTDSHTNLARGEKLATLTAAPYQSHVWKTREAAVDLWGLLAEARSQFVRMWTIEMLRLHHSEWLSELNVEQLLQLLSSSDSVVAEFAMDLFRNHSSLSKVEVSTWLRLIGEAEFSVLPTLCEAMQQHLTPTRLSDEQLVELTMATPAAVASLGFRWLKERQSERRLPVASVARLADVRCTSEAKKIAAWAISEIAKDGGDTSRFITDFFDSRSDEVRSAACDWLILLPPKVPSNQAVQYDPALWVKLAETPYDEVRFSLVETLRLVLKDSRQAYLSSLPIEHQMRILSAVVLCVDRGSRSKPKAIEQLATLAGQGGPEAPTIVAVLTIAARSVRGPEQAAGLSALAQLANRSGELESLVAESVPEWDWAPDSASDNGIPRVAT